MDRDQAQSAFQPTIPGAVWRYRALVVALAVAGGLAGLALAATSPTSWVASSTLVVEDPRASAIFEIGSVQNPERYVENQVEIIRSPVVARRAAEILDDESSISRSAEEISDGYSVSSRTGRDLITITASDDESEAAIAIANALALAYQDVLRSEAARSFAAALAQLDSSIEAGETELAALQDRIVAERDSQADPGLGERLDALVARFVSLESRPSLTEAEQNELTALQDQIRTMQVILDIESQRPEFAALVEEQTEAIRRQSTLLARRDQLSVDAEIAGRGVVLFSPADGAEQSGLSAARAVVAGTVLGSLLAAGLAYVLASSRRRFQDRHEPGVILEAPLIAEIPDFGTESIPDLLPVVSAPASVAAEAFRFAAVTLAARSSGQRAPRPPAGLGALLVVSADPGDGKSVVAANMALASAADGKRVLAVDTDFGNQRLSSLLDPGGQSHAGLTEVVLDGLPANEAIRSIPVDGEGALRLLSRGEVVTRAAELFHDTRVARLLVELKDSYDLVVIDAPPLLHVAYAAALVSMADSTVVVVKHGSRMSVLEELQHRLTVLDDRSLVGYVYNKSPQRRSPMRGVGSTIDVVGANVARAGAAPSDQAPSP